MTQTIQIVLNDNTKFTVEVQNYNNIELTNMLNNNQIMFVNIGGLILVRNAIKIIMPISTTEVTV